MARKTIQQLSATTLPVQSTDLIPLARGSAAATSATIGDLPFNGPVTVKAYGAKGDGLVVRTGAMTSASATLTIGSSLFTSDDVGKECCVKGAGAAGADLFTTISAYVSAMEVTLADAAGTTVSSAEAQWGTDDTAAIQLALDARCEVYFPKGIYVVTGELVWKDGSRAIGAGAHWKRRKVSSAASYQYTHLSSTVLLYMGAAGALTCVARLSEKAVGTKATSVAAGDDLINVTAQNIHVDANNRAQYGWYLYRCGNTAQIGNLTGERAVRANHIHLGCYAAFFGTFGSYEGMDLGTLVGYDEFSWGDGEETCFAYFAEHHLVNNGTNQVFVAGTGTDLNDAGGWFRIGRGSDVTLVSEGNYGRAAILQVYPVSGGTGGIFTLRPKYIEANGAGCRIFRYGPLATGLIIDGGFIHPGNGSTLLSQNFLITAVNSSNVTTAGEGPEDPSQWVVFRNLQGDLNGVGFEIDSNTSRFIVEGCYSGIVYPNYRPAAIDGVFYAASFGLATYATPTVNANAIQDAIDAASVITRTITADKVDDVTGIVQLPAGAFDVDLDVITIKEGVTLRGQSMSTTSLSGGGAAGVIVQMGGVSREYSQCVLSDLSVYGDATGNNTYDATTGLIGVQVDQAYRLCSLDRVKVFWCDTNILANTFAFEINDCWSNSANTHCLHIQRGTQFKVSGGRYQSAADAIIYMESSPGTGAAGLEITGAAIQSGEKEALKVEDFRQITVSGCFMEGNNNGGGTYHAFDFSNSATDGTVNLFNNAMVNTGAGAGSHAAIRTNNVSLINATGNWIRDTDGTAEWDYGLLIEGATRVLNWQGNYTQFDGSGDVPVEITGTVEHSVQLLMDGAFDVRGPGTTAASYDSDDMAGIFGTLGGGSVALGDVDGIGSVQGGGSGTNGDMELNPQQGVIRVRALRYRQTESSSNVVMDRSDGDIFINTSGGNRTVDLPDSPTGRRVTITKTTNDGNTLTITPNGSDTINGSATLVLSAAYASTTLQKRSTGVWSIVAEV